MITATEIGLPRWYSISLVEWILWLRSPMVKVGRSMIEEIASKQIKI